jgi:hypothetical protein
VPDSLRRMRSWMRWRIAFLLFCVIIGVSSYQRNRPADPFGLSAASSF